MYGPVPHAWLFIASSPFFSTKVGLYMANERFASTALSPAYGWSSLIRVVESLTTSTVLKGSRSNGEYFLLILRSRFHFTASALKGVPSWNLTPCWSCQVTVRPSGETCSSLTNIGWTF